MCRKYKYKFSSTWSGMSPQKTHTVLCTRTNEKIIGSGSKAHTFFYALLLLLPFLLSCASPSATTTSSFRFSIAVLVCWVALSLSWSRSPFPYCKFLAYFVGWRCGGASGARVFQCLLYFNDFTVCLRSVCVCECLWRAYSNTL